VTRATSSGDGTADLVVVGGGLVGGAIAWGAARQGLRVALMDEGDTAFRAARGNFGLVWVQGKGYGSAPYARWTINSSRQWPQLAAMLQGDIGIDVQLRQPGGFHICLSPQEWDARKERLTSIRDALGGDYPIRFLNRDEASEYLPGLGPEVVGVSHCALDGHVNPLKLLRALHTACQTRGVRLHGGHGVSGIERRGQIYRVSTAEQTIETPRVVLAAGLGNRALAPMVGLHAPVIPNRGQVLVGERTGHFLDYPTTHIRQTDEGTIQLGESMEEAGLDDTTTTPILSMIAARAARSFPVLKDLQLVRVWSALRVMSPDGSPIYAESPSHPGAFVATCHSGVTLCAAHFFQIAPWVAGGPRPDGTDAFSDRRFAPAPQLQTA
jgi:glycine/D-amino acid oxidase-like deaminating enzyme